MTIFEKLITRDIKKLEREVKYGKATDGEIKYLAALKELLRASKVGVQ